MPLRIASLISSATEILFALGLDDSIVAVSHECDAPPAALRKPRVTCAHVDSSASSGAIDAEVKRRVEEGAALYAIDVERLARLAPDLIVTQAQCDVRAVRYAEVEQAVASRPELRQTRIVALNPQSLGDVLADIERIAVATDRAGEGARLVAQLRGRIEAVRQSALSIPLELRPRTAIVEWTEPLMLAGNWLPAMVELAGGRHDLTTAGQHSPYVDWPALAEYDPEVLLVAPCGFDLERTLAEVPVLREHPEWRQLAAVQTGRAFAVDGNAYFNRSGPRLVETLELLAHLIDPARWPAPPAEDAARWQSL